MRDKNNTSAFKIVFKLPYLLFFPAALILVDWAKSNPDKVENIYSTKIYPLIGKSISFIFSFAKVSVAEMLILALVVLLPLGLVFNIARKKDSGYHSINYVVTVLAAASVGYFLFIGIWGLNYYRQPLAKTLGYEVRDSSTQELEELCKDLIADANELREQLDEDENGVLALPYSKYELFENVSDAYEKYGEDNSLFAGKYSNPKPVMLSEKMCYTEITGIYIPFTAEANVNVAIMPMSLANTAAHEAAHQRGVAREDEANFMSYLICRDYGDTYMQYSGTILALIYSMNALASSDIDTFYNLAQQYGDGVRRDLDANREFWKQYEGKAAEIADDVNNAYLVSNNQEDGVKSYCRMVDLLLAERR
ncbi:MAG: DUF3810 domain-containing protein [Eubacteriales bacterium]